MAEIILTSTPLLIAFLGGLIPSLIWLWFWHRQDRDCPEPTGLIIISFVAGMVVIFFVFPLQKLIFDTAPLIMHGLNQLAETYSFTVPSVAAVHITLWAAVEEIAKYLVVTLIALRSRFYNEPMDALVYILTVAIGFSAMENALYILKDLSQHGIFEVIRNGELRFIGATIAHMVCSAIVGVALAFTFPFGKIIRAFAVVLGLIGATLLHAYFNLSIMNASETIDILIAFAPLWVAVMAIIVIIAIIKKITRPNNTCPIQ